MTLTIGKYNAEIVDKFSLPDSSGVYVIFNKKTMDVIDIGESKNILSRVLFHDREDCWKKQIKIIDELGYSYIIADEENRMLIEKELRKNYNPLCGDR